MTVKAPRRHQMPFVPPYSATATSSCRSQARNPYTLVADLESIQLHTFNGPHTNHRSPVIRLSKYCRNSSYRAVAAAVLLGSKGRRYIHTLRDLRLSSFVYSLKHQHSVSKPRVSTPGTYKMHYAQWCQSTLTHSSSLFSFLH